MRSHRRRWFLVLGVALLATVPALTQELSPGTSPSARAAWTSFEGEALLAEPVEISVNGSLRKACSDFELPPEPALLRAPELSDYSALSELEGLAACMTSGPLRGYEIEIFGSSELPGKVLYPAESSGPADVVRAALGRLGVPFSLMTVSDVDQNPMGSAHPAARVSVALRDEPPSNDEVAP
jgi:hypothetical protein